MTVTRPTEALHLRRNGNPRGRAPRGETSSAIPRSLVIAADWSWRLLLVGIVAYAAVRVLALLSLVVIPLLAAVFLAALLRPVAGLLRRWLPGPLSALLTLFLAALGLGGIGYLVGTRFAQQLPSLIQQLVGTVRRLRSEFTGVGVGQLQLDQIENSVIGWIQRNQSEAVGYLTTGASYFVEFFTLLVLTLFITFFLLYDSERIWRWLISPLPPRESRRVDAAGRAAWATTTGYVRGTAVIATIHGIVIGVAMFLLGAPLALPLGVLIFLGSFIPFVGALVAGGLAVLITFTAQGWVIALVLLGILIVESQLEAHLFQPLIVGRYVRLHPLAVGLSFAVGTVLAGIVGAIIAVPTAAVINQVWPVLRSHPSRSGHKPH
ncbi:MAG TPA: AI-2E family transporter [Pseudonocardiaceae bacterium]|jgi:predicted PurR-regulated permease PerM|nr:AI-2E family transporter [Pseudonocardiaceae bacterium]